MPDPRKAKIKKLQADMKELKVKIDDMKKKKERNPLLFSKIEDMQLKNLISMYNELVFTAKNIAKGS